MVAFIAIRGNPVVTAPAGWSLVRTDDNGDSLYQATYTRVATSSEPASYRWSFEKAHAAAGAILDYSGVNTRSPIAATSEQVTSDSNDISAPSVSSSVPGTAGIGFFTIAKDTSIAPPSYLAERVETGSTSGQYKLDMEVSTRPAVSAGATGPQTAVAGKSGPNIGELILLMPA